MDSCDHMITGSADEAAADTNFTAAGGFGGAAGLPVVANVILPSGRLSSAALHALPAQQLVALIEAGVVRAVTAAAAATAVTSGTAAAYALNSTTGADAGPAIPVQAIALNLIPQALALNESVRLCLTCARSAEDPSNSLCIDRRIRPIAAHLMPQDTSDTSSSRWIIAYFPRGIAPSQVFNASLQLVDVESGELLTADSATGTTCDLSLVRPPNAGTRIIAPTAVSESGLVHFRTITLAARPGSSVNVSVQCSRGGIALPVLPSSVQPLAVLPCPAGQVGRTGSFACDVCSDGTYTDGVGEAECSARHALCVWQPALAADCRSILAFGLRLQRSRTCSSS